MHKKDSVKEKLYKSKKMLSPTARLLGGWAKAVTHASTGPTTTAPWCIQPAEVTVVHCVYNEKAQEYF